MELVLTLIVLIFLEGILSLDNAVVLAVMVKDLPEKQHKKALLYGVWGAIGFRLIALFFLTYIIQFQFIKVAGGLYLIWLAFKYFVLPHEKDAFPHPIPSFWRTVFMVEIMDIVFSVDSIMASVAVSDKLWVLFFGGLVGILMMRIAANIFSFLINKYPWLETCAYGLITAVGGKLLLQGCHIL